MEKAFRLLLNTSCGLTFCFSRASHYVPANVGVLLTLAAGAVVVILLSTVSSAELKSAAIARAGGGNE